MEKYRISSVWHAFLALYDNRLHRIVDGRPYLDFGDEHLHWKLLTAFEAVFQNIYRKKS